MVNTGFATIDLNGLEVETKNNAVTIAGIYDKLEKMYNSYKPFLLTNYISKLSTNPTQKGRPVIASVTRPTGATFYIEFLAHTGIVILQVTINNNVKVNEVYGYHNIYTPPATTNLAKKAETETENGNEVN